MTRLLFNLLAPLLCLGLLAGMEMERLTHRQPADAEPYHARAADAVRRAPRTASVDGNPWSAMQVKVPEAAIKLLGGAEALCLHYTGRVNGRDCSADLLIVHCQNSRDMTGHYPPICYPGTGYTEIFRTDLGVLDVSGRSVPFMEYHFAKESQGQAHSICVYNFFIVPGRGVVREIQDVRDAAEDYQRRFFGSAQFQVLVSADLPARWREQILHDLIRANFPILNVLDSAEVEAK